MVHVLSGGYRSDYQIFDLEAEKVLKTGIQSSLNPGGDGDVVVSGTSIYNIENMVLSVSPHVISDENNARLLVHIYNISCLYAYYPDMATWECLVPDFTAWYPSTKALFHHVLFYHLPESSKCLIAFDLSTKKWFKVKYSSNFPRQHISFCEWEGFLHLGNDIMCLASYCPFGDPVHTNICFLKFRVERISSHELLLTFVSSQSFPFEGRLIAYRFLLLP